MPLAEKHTIIVDIITNLKAFGNSLTASKETFKKFFKETKDGSVAFNKHYTAMRSTLGRFGAQLRLLTGGFMGFRMELLSVMFFGMALKKFFGDLIQPVMDLFNVSELWRVSMQVLLLPAMTDLFPVFLEFLGWLWELSPAMQEVIGWTIFLGWGFGTVLQSIGMFGLGLSGIISLIKIMKEHWTGIVAVLTLLGKTFGVILGVLLLFKAGMDIAKGKTQGLGLAVIALGLILIPFLGIFALIPIAIGTALYFALKHWDNFRKGVELVLNSIIDAIEWMINKVIDGLNLLISALNKVLKKDIEPIKHINIGWKFGEGNPPLSEAPGYKGPKSPFETLGGTIPPTGRESELTELNKIFEMLSKREPVNITQYNDFKVSDKAEFEKMLEEAQKKYVEDMEKMIKT